MRAGTRRPLRDHRRRRRGGCRARRGVQCRGRTRCEGRCRGRTRRRGQCWGRGRDRCGERRRGCARYGGPCRGRTRRGGRRGGRGRDRCRGRGGGRRLSCARCRSRCHGRDRRGGQWRCRAQSRTARPCPAWPHPARAGRPAHHRRRRVRATEPPRPRGRGSGAGRPLHGTSRRSRASTGRPTPAALRGSRVRRPLSYRRRGTRTDRLPPGACPPRADHGPPRLALHRLGQSRAGAGGEGPLSDQGQHPRTMRLALRRGPVKPIRRRARGALLRRRTIGCRGTRVRPSPRRHGRRQRPLNGRLSGREPGHRHHRQPSRIRYCRCPVGQCPVRRGRVAGPPRRRHRAVERAPHRALHSQRWHHLRSGERAVPVDDSLHRSARRRPP